MNIQEKIDIEEMLETEIRAGRKKVDYNTVGYPLEFFVKQISQQQINDGLNWDTSQQSLFIESLLMGLPVLNIVADDDWNIIDGKQRLYTAINFINGNLKLENLKTLSSLNHFRFQNLLPFRQRAVKRTDVRAIIISPSSDISYWLDYQCH